MAKEEKGTMDDTSEVALHCATDSNFVKSVLYPSDSLSRVALGLLEAVDRQSPSDIIRQVQRRVSELEREVSLLKSHRNVVASNIPLPTELLSSIFCILQESTRGTWKGLRDWIRVSHVCRHWRKVALDCHALWAYVTTESNRRSMDVMIERSRQAPLSVYFRSWTEEDDQKLLHVVAQTHRLQSLELSRDAGYKSSPIKDVLSRFSGPPALLEKLVVTGHKRREEQVYGMPPDNEIDEVPMELTNLDFPRLRRLEITRCVIPWGEIPMAPSLTSLKLHTLPRTGSVSALTFFGALKNMPFLRSIDLVDTLPSDEWAGDAPRTVLKSLQTLKVRGTVPQLRSFLRATQIPVEATPHLGFTTDPTAEESAALLSALETCWVYIPKEVRNDLKPTFSSKFQTFGMSDVDDERESYEEVKYPTLYWWFGPALPAKSKARPRIENARLAISFAEQQRSTYQALRLFLAQLDFGSLRCLHVDNCPSLDTDAWDVFNRLTKLVTIIFRNGQTMKSFALKIKEDPVDGPGSAIEDSGSESGSGSESDSDDYYSSKKKTSKQKEIVPKPYFPSLKYVRCFKVHFGDPNGWGSTAKTVDHLVNGFGKRPRPKYSRLTMYVTECINFSRGDVSYMRETSDCNVIFDGSQCWDREYREAQYRDDPMARLDAMFW